MQRDFGRQARRHSAEIYGETVSAGMSLTAARWQQNAARANTSRIGAIRKPARDFAERERLTATYAFDQHAVNTQTDGKIKESMDRVRCSSGLVAMDARPPE
jgi:hypothetical protein